MSAGREGSTVRSLTTEHLPALLQEVTRIADKAGMEILRVYERADVSVVNKTDGSPLTAADMAAHETILAGLQALSEYPILSEESADIPFDVRKNWSSFWLVDPLDGTREFVARNGEFTVNIALIHAGRPVLGVVHAPALRKTYWAADEAGAFARHGDGAPERIHTRAAVGPPMIAASRSHAGEALPRFLKRFGSHTLVDMGSSLKLCLVAQGAAQLYPRLGTTCEWDIAAAHCVVTQAGGTVSDFAGNELTYNKPDMRNPWFLAAADEAMRKAALDAFVAAGEMK